jgi:hypothetical protein
VFLVVMDCEERRLFWTHRNNDSNPIGRKLRTRFSVECSNRSFPKRALVERPDQTVATFDGSIRRISGGGGEISNVFPQNEDEELAREESSFTIISATLLIVFIFR